MTTPVLQCVDLTSGYSGVPVIRNLNMEVNEGELVAILGPNGAGKTTTLLTMAGVLSAISGAVTLLGQTVRGGRPDRVARRGLLLVPDDRSIFFELTARENVRMARNMSHQEAVKLVLEYFPALESRMGMRAGLLSGGEQQMLAIGRALMGKPRLILLDEPSMGLAPLIVAQIFDIIGEINRQGVTVLLVEQNAAQALTLADRGYVLETGEIVLQGGGRALLADDRVRAAYLGEEIAVS
jgi:branched-chain amino acid transport system ATP-binding protein